jgi:hypothetical protein
MSHAIKPLKELVLNGTKDGRITIGFIEEPYGVGSETVVSIGISLKSNADEPDWKVHIPKANIDDVIEALIEAKKVI